MISDVFKRFLLGLLFTILSTFIIALVLLISIPFWSESKKVCKYWEKKDGNMQCIQETIFYCLGKCEEVQDEMD